MTTTEGAEVLPLQRPPVRQTVHVRAPQQRTFDVFVRQIGAWWPLDPFSYGTDRIERVTFEQRLGGRVYETWRDGTERDWGTVVAWDPPHRFAMMWNITGTPTEVELTFAAMGDETEVHLEHRGWDTLTDEELRRACALPGGYLGGAFRAGWARILTEFVMAAEN